MKATQGPHSPLRFYAENHSNLRWFRFSHRFEESCKSSNLSQNTMHLRVLYSANSSAAAFFVRKQVHFFTILLYHCGAHVQFCAQARCLAAFFFSRAFQKFILLRRRVEIWIFWGSRRGNAAQGLWVAPRVLGYFWPSQAILVDNIKGFCKVSPKTYTPLV